MRTINSLFLVCLPFWFFSCGKSAPPIEPEGEIVLYPSCHLGTALLWKGDVDPARLREAASKPEFRDGDCMLVWAWDKSSTWKFLANRSGTPRAVYHESGNLSEIGTVTGDIDVSTSGLAKDVLIRYIQRFDASLAQPQESAYYIVDSVNGNCYFKRASAKGTQREEVADSFCEPSPEYEAWLDYLENKGYLGPK